jgi:hypothetical protein
MISRPATRFHGTAYDLFIARNRPPDIHPGSTGRLPKLNFPSFDGDNTRHWISRAESYIEMYSVVPAMWVKVYHMHFLDASAHWVQSVGPQLCSMSWPVFRQLVHVCVGRDQHQLLFW